MQQQQQQQQQPVSQPPPRNLARKAMLHKGPSAQPASAYVEQYAVLRDVAAGELQVGWKDAIFYLFLLLVASLILFLAVLGTAGIHS
jgi:hypothetical protein